MDLAPKLWLRCAALWAFALLAALSPSLARATEVATRLEYGAAPGCPGAEDFVAVVAGRLGYRPFRKDASERVVVRIERDGKALEGRIEWRDAAGGWIGEQTLPSRTGNCPELVHAMGFAVAVQFQLMATNAARPGVESPPPAPARAQPTAPAPGAVASPAASVPSQAAVVSAQGAPATSVPPTPLIETPQPPAPSPPRPEAAAVPSEAAATSSPGPSLGPSWAVGAGAAAAFDAAPSVVPVGRLFGAVSWTHVGVELGGEISLPSSTIAREDGAGFTHEQAMGTLAGCGLVSAWSACLIAKAGAVRVKGKDVDVPATATAPLVQIGARLTWTHTLGGRFEIGAHADGVVLATEGKVTLDSLPVWTTPRLTASLGVDVGVRFR